MRWSLSWRTDPRARVIADRHYTRQHVGAQDFVPPGRCLVLWCGAAYWVTSWPYAQYTRHRWRGAWVCSAFRNEGHSLSSDLIHDAVAATRWRFGRPPALGMVTFVDPTAVRHKRDPGRCFLRAGFIRDGETQGGLLALRLYAERMPEPIAPIGAQYDLLPARQ